MAKSQRDKGNRAELRIVRDHKALGIHAVKRSGMYIDGHDIDIYTRGPDEAPLVTECKARKSNAGFKFITDSLGENDALFVVIDRQEPLVVLPWRTWAEMVGKDV